METIIDTGIITNTRTVKIRKGLGITMVVFYLLIVFTPMTVAFLLGEPKGTQWLVSGIFLAPPLLPLLAVGLDLAIEPEKRVLYYI